MQQYRIAWPPLTTGLKILFAVYGAVFVIDPLFSGSFGYREAFHDLFALSNQGMFDSFYLWQPITYQLVHADFFHLLFNGMVLYFFAAEVEKRWNTKWFLLFAFSCGIGAALAVIAWQLLLPLLTGAPGLSRVSTVGASGAVTGIIAAFALYNWDRGLRFFMIPFEVKGKWLLVFFVAIDMLFALMGDNNSVAAHLGGMGTGLLIVSGYYKPGRLIQRYKIWRFRRKIKVLGGRGPDKPNGTYH